jgi:hypothetical protein
MVTIKYKRSLRQSKGIRISNGTSAKYISFCTTMSLREYFKACNQAGVSRYV